MVATAALAPVALLVPASASGHSIDGVRAHLKRGTLRVKGGDRADTIALRLKSGDPTRIQVDVGDDGSADFAFDRRDVDAIRVRAGDGDDSARIDDANGAFTDSIPTTLAGGAGDDSLEGGQVQIAAENERFRGGDGDDFVDGGKGADTAYLGGGSDTFRWDPGEGSDVIEGQDGADTMLFNGAAGGETVTMRADGGRLTFFRQPGSVTMSTDEVEIVDFNALGGQDNVTVDDLSGTDVARTELELAGAPGGTVADGLTDAITLNATDGDDAIAIDAIGSAGVDVTGLATEVSIEHPDATDDLAVNTLAGDDHVTADSTAGVMRVFVDGALI